MTGIIVSVSGGANLITPRAKEVSSMRAVAYIHPDQHIQEKRAISLFCQENDVELVGYYMDGKGGPLENRRALGEMLNSLRGGYADCALCVTDPNDPHSVQVRFCAQFQCMGGPRSGICQKGFIGHPELCVFR